MGGGGSGPIRHLSSALSESAKRWRGWRVAGGAITVVIVSH